MKDSRSFTIGKLKQGAKPAPEPVDADAPAPSKKKSDLKKRVVVGFFFLTWYCTPAFVHPVALVLVTSQMAYIIFKELLELKIKDFDLSRKIPFFRTILFLIFQYACLPKFGVLERGIMEKSGFS